MKKKKGVSPRVERAVADRLVFLLEWNADDKGTGTFPTRVSDRIQSAISRGQCERWFGAGLRYLHSVRVNFRSGAHAAIQLGATNRLTQRGDVRVELNPSQMTAEDIERFHKLMRGIIGKKYRSLLTHPLVNRLDAAVDVVDLVLENVLVKYQHAQRYTVFGKMLNRGGRLETLMFGGKSSDYVSAVYDKKTERLHALVTKIAKEGLANESIRANRVSQLKRLRGQAPVTRIEVRGRKLRGARLSSLLTQPNRFERFSFCDLRALDELSPLVRDAFVSLARDRGVREALRVFKAHGKAAAYSRLKKLVELRPAWWQPEGLWARVFDSLRDSKLFSEQAFAAAKVDA